MKELFIESIGKIEVRKSRRNKRLVLSSKEGGKLRVSAPFLVKDKQIIAFVKTNQDWIRKQQATDRKGFCELLMENGRLQFPGFSIQLVKSIKTELYKEQDCWYIQAPIEQVVAEQIKVWIEQVLVLQAKQVLPERMVSLSRTMGLEYNQLKINKAKTRWGSCSYYNNINLSCYLVCLSKELQDYVMIHELCHIVHKNHSWDFWNMVEQYVENLKSVKKELSQIKYYL